MDEYLAFVDLVGRGIKGSYIYRFDFTYDKDSAWGEYFNVSPAVIIPSLKLDDNCISSSMKVEFVTEMLTASKNYCFSMQDCIDGIFPLCFSNLDEDFIDIDGKPLFFSFGENILDVKKKIEDCQVKINSHDYIKTKTDIIDKLADDIKNNIDIDDLDF